MKKNEYHRHFANVEGARLLREFFAKADREWTQVRLANALGVHKNTVHFWTTGFRRPTHELKLALSRIARIHVDAWMTRAERSKAMRLRAA